MKQYYPEGVDKLMTELNDYSQEIVPYPRQETSVIDDEQDKPQQEVADNTSLLYDGVSGKELKKNASKLND